MFETEITVQVYNTISEIRQTLINQGYTIEKQYYLYDYYFSKYDTDALLKKNYGEIIKNSILVRKFDKQTPYFVICYKNKTIDENGVVKEEEKISSKINDIDSTLKILDMAGLNNYCNLTTKLTVFKKNNVQFALQEVDGLGTFIEFEEYDEISGLPTNEKIYILKNTLNTLNLNLGNDYSVKKIYEMFLKNNNP